MKPNIVEVPPKRIPDEPVAVIQDTGNFGGTWVTERCRFRGVEIVKGLKVKATVKISENGTSQGWNEVGFHPAVEGLFIVTSLAPEILSEYVPSSLLFPFELNETTEDPKQGSQFRILKRVLHKSEGTLVKWEIPERASDTELESPPQP